MAEASDNDNDTEPSHAMTQTCSVTSRDAAEIAKTAERLEFIKRQGRLRLLRIRVPTMSAAMMLILSTFVLAVIFDPNKYPYVRSSLMVFLSAALVMWSLAILPSDRCLFKVTSGCIIPLSGFLGGVGVAIRAYKEFPKGSGECNFVGEAVNCSVMYVRALGSAVGAVVILLMTCALFRIYSMYGATSKSQGEALRLMWKVLSLCYTIFSTTAVARTAVDLTAAKYEHAGGDAFTAVAWFLLGIFTFNTELIKRLQSKLAFRDKAAVSAAGISELLSGWNSEKVLRIAETRFLYVVGSDITREDMAMNTPDPELKRFAKKGTFGHVDVFLSHSWHDNAESKWACLQEFRKEYVELHGKEPRIWIDKYCIDQKNIEESLACLPVYLSGCKKLLIMCGDTYFHRLWCLIEIMVFFEMGGILENLEVRSLEADSKMRQQLTGFDSTMAACSTIEETNRLQLILDVTGHDCINQLVNRTFIADRFPLNSMPNWKTYDFDI